ncbi:MAG: hypothetical protein HeimC2_17940 [Candidatus Heimdallarchaeota archaeon LC_2]|nr:MAG: hypothetical protein HeimC2_17940 [Candidatus Heimdallarchaeota archaeon LC_2]
MIKSDTIYCSKYNEYIDKIEIKPDCVSYFNFEIIEGNLNCNLCDSNFPILNKIANLLPLEILNRSRNQIHTSNSDSIDTKVEELHHHNQEADEYEPRCVNHQRFHQFYKRKSKHLLKYFPKVQNFKVLDTGCGSSKVSIFMVQNNYVIGGEISFELLKIFAKKSESKKLLTDFV